MYEGILELEMEQRYDEKKRKFRFERKPTIGGP